MTLPRLRVAVVGHTNTGKTSLLRTLLRDVEFGEVSSHAGTTRQVEGAALSLDGMDVITLYDTPGLEDSIGLREHLDSSAGGQRIDGIELINKFLDSEEARARFGQEAKALRQLMDCDVVLYVVDARDRVRGKHRDELDILGRCARPVVPVLNFVASDGAQTAQWREHLARVNMHAVAEFDTVVFSETEERILFEKIRTLADSHATTLNAIIDQRSRRRTELIEGSAEHIADLLIDVAAYFVSVPADQAQTPGQSVEALRQCIRQREQTCVQQVLELHRFRPEDCQAEELPLEDGQWGLDLFSPEAMKQFGVRSGGGAATGAAVGATVGLLAGGISVPIGAAVGAGIGAVYGAARSRLARVFKRVRGLTDLRCDDATLQLLEKRQLALTNALSRRGHASVDPALVTASPAPEAGSPTGGSGKWSLPATLSIARTNPKWSRLAEKDDPLSRIDPKRDAAMRELAKAIADRLRRYSGERSEA